jgi:hypothetical protein
MRCVSRIAETTLFERSDIASATATDSALYYDGHTIIVVFG